MNTCKTCWEEIEESLMYCSVDCASTETEDIINKPKHYTKWGIEPIDYIMSNNMDFCEWACIKYITRYKYKNWLEDLKKAAWFLQKLIDKFD